MLRLQESKDEQGLKTNLAKEIRPVKSDYGLRKRKDQCAALTIPDADANLKDDTSRGSTPSKMKIPAISLDSSDSPYQTQMKKKRYQRYNSVPPESNCGEAPELSDFIEKSPFVSEQIHKLAKAFFQRAESVRQRLTQPPTPSTDASLKGYTSFSPPPLSSRYELESLTTAYEAKKGKRRWRWGHLRFPKAIDRQ
ncbi:hypothetical protein QYM36_002976, partial [Artemia franciscana]